MWTQLGTLTKWLVAATLCVAAVSIARAEKVYWTEYALTERSDQLKRANLDGSGIEVVLDTGDSEGLLAIEVAPVAGKLYWSAFVGFSGVLRWANLDGSEVENLYSDIASPGGIGLDLAEGRLHYTQPSDCSPGCGRVYSSDLDGANREALLQLNTPHDLDLDLVAGRMYWSDIEDRNIRSADLDGIDGNVVVVDTVSFGIAVDPGAGKLYWTDWERNRVRRANLDGSDIEDLVLDQNQPQGIDLDLANQKMYWVDTGAGKIRRADLDGHLAEDVISGLDHPMGLSLELGEGAIVLTLDAASLDWAEPLGALGYDVVAGNLTTLRRSRGDFAAATENCIAEDSATSSLDPIDWPAGESVWFLVRAVTATGDGTYGSFGRGEATWRDSGILVSGLDCLREE